jgi:solute carrier family 25 (mitochondrial carnitine/acylcarnitine transporter), member 20/29
MQTTATTETVAGMFMKTFRTSGIPGLYKGVSAPLLAVTPMFAVQFWGYDMGQRFISYTSHTPTTDLSLVQKCMAGGLSAIPATALMAPSERIKVLLQTAPAGTYRNMLDCAYKVYQSGGVASIFRGTGLTLMRDIPGSIAWFGTYEAVKLYMMRAQGMTDTSQLSPVSVLTAGGIAGMTCWTVSIPMDVLKSRFQSAPDGTYKGASDVLRTLLREEGAGALFTGIRPALIRAFPANAACFFGMEVARKLFAFMD